MGTAQPLDVRSDPAAVVTGGYLGAELSSELNEARRNGMDTAMSARYLADRSAVPEEMYKEVSRLLNAPASADR